MTTRTKAIIEEFRAIFPDSEYMEIWGEAIEFYFSQAIERVEKEVREEERKNLTKYDVDFTCPCGQGHRVSFLIKKPKYMKGKITEIKINGKELSSQEEKISFEEGLEIVKKIQEKKDCVCEQCPECGKFIELPFRQYHIEHECLSKPSHPSSEELEEQITVLSFQLTDMLMRMYTSKKHKETFYVSKISEKLQKIIDEKLEAQKERIRKNVGQLRQWLNEDRITDYKKMVTNEEIEAFLEGKL